MTTVTEVPFGKAAIEAAETVSAELKQERVALRGFKPGDPERERRIEEALVKQYGAVLDIMSAQAKARWRDGLLSPAEYSRLGELSADLSRHRRQLKKMRR